MGYEPLDAELSSIGAGGSAGAPADITGGALVGSTTSGGGASGTTAATTGIAGFINGDGGFGAVGGSDAGGATSTSATTGETSTVSAASMGGAAGSGGVLGTVGAASSGGAFGTSSTTSTSGGSASTGGAGGSGTGGTGGLGAGGSGAAGSGGSGAAGSGGTGEPGVGEDPYCQRLHHLASAPVIDGALDGNLPLQDLPKDAVRVPSANPPEFSSLPSDVRMRFAAAWFDAGLYLFVEVVDPNRYPARANDDEWMGDGIDIYVDHDAVFNTAPGFYDDPGTRSLAVAAPNDASTPAARGSIYMPFVDLGAWSGNQFVAVPTADGYRIEAVVTAATLALPDWSPSPAAPFAFDLGHNVSFPAGETGIEGRRLGHYFVRAADGADGDFEDYPFYNSAVFCVPTLVAP